jgi:branched-subunit amino acid ABC-type transport system permease component
VFDWQFFLLLLVNGVLIGLTYALIALGFVLVYKATDAFNFAQGEMVMFGGLLVAVGVDVYGVPLWASVGAGLAAMIGFGFALERVVLRPLAGRPVIAVIMATFGLGYILRGVGPLAWGAETKAVPLPVSDSPLVLGPLLIPPVELLGAAISLAFLGVFAWFFLNYVIAHLFGRAPSVSIKEFRRVGYPLNHVVSLVWGASEADIEAAGGFGVAEGYHGLEFAGVGENYPVLDEIRAMYRKEGKAAPPEMASTVYYNRGVLTAAVQVQAIKNALEAKHGEAITGADVKAGMEHINGLTLGGLVPPLDITPADHEGGGWVQVWHVKGGKFVKETDWFKSYPQVIAAGLKLAATKP